MHALTRVLGWDHGSQGWDCMYLIGVTVGATVAYTTASGSAPAAMSTIRVCMVCECAAAVGSWFL